MFKGLLLLVALWALIAFASARPLMLFADQTDAPLGLSNGFSGVAFALTSITKGNLGYRVRIFGVANINATITNAWIAYQNGTVIDFLAFAKSDIYYLTDTRINDTVYHALLSEQVYIVTATSASSTGIISGYFRCRPHSGLSLLTASDVVSGGGSNSSASAIGWAEITVNTINSLPNDVLSQDSSINSNSFFNGRVLQINNTGITSSIGFYGPANVTKDGALLATATISGSFSDGVFSAVTPTSDFYSIDQIETYYQVNATDGGVRGQVYPLLAPTRRKIPTAVSTVAGTTVYPGAGLQTLRYANQIGKENNANSYMQFVATANPSNFTYIGVVTFPAATNKRNANNVRALSVEMNGRIVGNGTWLFEFFDATLGEFIPVATWTSASQWTPAFIDDYNFLIREYANKRNEITMRVSVNSASTTTLQLDVFGIRSYTPYAKSNKFLRLFTKFLAQLPANFANGTAINQ